MNRNGIASESIPARVGLSGNEDQARTYRFRFCWMTEGRKNREDHQVSGQDAKAHRSENCEAKDQGHHQRIHDHHLEKAVI